MPIIYNMIYNLMGFLVFLNFCWLVGNVIPALSGTPGFSGHCPAGLIEIYITFF